MRKSGTRCGVYVTVIAAFLLGGCGTPRFMVASEPTGTPTVALIVERITCELADLVRKEGDFARYRGLLREAGYEVAVSLSLLVSEKGELAPNFNFPVPPNFGFNVGAAVSRSREQQFSSRRTSITT